MTEERDGQAAAFVPAAHEGEPGFVPEGSEMLVKAGRETTGGRFGLLVGVDRPGFATIAHRHDVAEAWYVLADLGSSSRVFPTTLVRSRPGEVSAMTSQESSADRPERVLADLLALLAIADQALLLQERAEAVLQACAAPGEPSHFVAREGGRVAGEYHRLWGWSLDFAPYAGDGSLERRLSDLVMQHYRLLKAAVRLAFPRQPPRTTVQPAGVVEDLTRWAGELRSVRDELDLWITALTPAR